MPVTSDNGVPIVVADAFKRRVVLLSPIVVVGLGFALARITVVIWGAWSWIPVILYYWVILVVLIVWGGGREAVRRWLQPSRTGRWIWVWRVLALALPALFVPPVFLLSLASMNRWWVVVFWFGLGAINPWIEEGYWRGLLMDAASHWPAWLAALYSAVCFGASHPLIFGYPGADALQGYAGFFGTFIAGVIWSLVYQQTRSLRLPIVGHLLQHMLAPPYLVLLQLIAILG